MAESFKKINGEEYGEGWSRKNNLIYAALKLSYYSVDSWVKSKQISKHVCLERKLAFNEMHGTIFGLW